MQVIRCSLAELGLPRDSNHQFYQEFCKLYFANIILTGRVSFS